MQSSRWRRRLAATAALLAALAAPAQAEPPAEGRAWSRAQLDAGPLGRLRAVRALDDADPARRSDAARAIGQRGADEIPLLLHALGDPEPATRALLALGLARGGLDGWIEVEGELDLRATQLAPLALAAPARPALQRRLRLLGQLELPLRLAAIEGELARQISPAGGYGSWRDQYAALQPYRLKVLPHLMRILRSPLPISCAPRAPHAERWRKLRFLAGMAIGQIALLEPAVLELLGDVARNPQRYLPEGATRFERQAFAQIGRRALYLQGQREPMERRIDLLHQIVREVARGDDTGERRADQAMFVADLAACYHASGNLQRAIRYYRKSLALSPRDSGLHYNLACALARSGATRSALDELERAVVTGYFDVDYMEMDGELASLRGDERFVRLIATMRARETP